MSPEELARYVLSFLGGGVVAAIGNWIHATRSARRQNEVQYLLSQLQNLYGPLYFFTSQNEQLFKLYNDIHNAYSAYFGRGWSREPSTQEALSAGAEATINLGNIYVRQVRENNEHVIEVLKNHWHLVDPDDLRVLSEFQVDHARFTTEVEKKEAQGVPFEISETLGSISYMRPEMIRVIQLAVDGKRERLRQLGAGLSTRPSKRLKLSGR
jgi:hypothetical protein